MKAAVQILVITAIVTIIGGCDTYRWWRDSYMGRAILEPHLSNARVERDSYGNPILPKGATAQFSTKKSLRHD